MASSRAMGLMACHPPLLLEGKESHVVFDTNGLHDFFLCVFLWPEPLHACSPNLLVDQAWVMVGVKFNFCTACIGMPPGCG